MRLPAVERFGRRATRDSSIVYRVTSTTRGFRPGSRRQERERERERFQEQQTQITRVDAHVPVSSFPRVASPLLRVALSAVFCCLLAVCHAAQAKNHSRAIKALWHPCPPHSRASALPSELEKPEAHLCLPERSFRRTVRAFVSRVCVILHRLFCRHFVKEDLPRIRYANPTIDIEVNKPLKTKEETWRPEMVVELSACTITWIFTPTHYIHL